MGAAMAGIVGLTIVAAVTTPPQEEAGVLTSVTDRILAGQDLFSLYCVECHGDEGQGGEIKGVEGLEGFLMKPLNVSDYMYTREDDTLAAIVDYGQPDLGMPPFGKAYGGELTPGDIQAHRDLHALHLGRSDGDPAGRRRRRRRADAGAGGDPVLHGAHPADRPAHLRLVPSGGQEEQQLPDGHLSGDPDQRRQHARCWWRATPHSLLLRLLRREEVTEIKDLNPMPPSRPLRPEWVEIFERWVAAGMPETPVPQATGPAVLPTGTPSPGSPTATPTRLTPGPSPSAAPATATG